MKKLTALILALALLITCVPLSVAAESEPLVKKYINFNPESETLYFTDSRTENSFSVFFDGEYDITLDEADYGLNILANNTKIAVPNDYLETERDLQYSLAGVAEVFGDGFVLYDKDWREFTYTGNMDEVLDFFDEPHADADFENYTFNNYREYFGDVYLYGNIVITENAFLDIHGSINAENADNVSASDFAFMFVDEFGSVSGLTLGRFTEDGAEEYEKDINEGQLFIYDGSLEMWMLQEEEEPVVRFHYREHLGELTDNNGGPILSEDSYPVDYIDNETPTHIEFNVNSYAASEEDVIAYVVLIYNCQGESVRDTVALTDTHFSKDVYADKCNIDVEISFSEDEYNFKESFPAEGEKEIILAAWGDANIYVTNTGDARVVSYDNETKIIFSSLNEFEMHMVPLNDGLPYKAFLDDSEIFDFFSLIESGELEPENGEYTVTVNTNDLFEAAEGNFAYAGIEFRYPLPLKSGQIRISYDMADGAEISCNGITLNSDEIYDLKDPTRILLEVTKPEGVTENGSARVRIMSMEEWTEYDVYDVEDTLEIENPEGNPVEIGYWFTEAQRTFDEICPEENQTLLHIDVNDPENAEITVLTENEILNVVTYHNMKKYLIDGQNNVVIKVKPAEGYTLNGIGNWDEEIDVGSVATEDGAYFIEYSFDDRNEMGFFFDIGCPPEWLPDDGMVRVHFNAKHGETVLLNGTELEPGEDTEYADGNNVITVENVPDGKIYAAEAIYVNGRKNWIEFDYDGLEIPLDTEDGKGVVVNIWFTEEAFNYDQIGPEEGEYSVHFGGNFADIYFESTADVIKSASCENEKVAVFSQDCDNEITVYMKPAEGFLMGDINMNGEFTLLVDKIIGEDPVTGALLYADDIIKYDSETGFYSYTFTPNKEGDNFCWFDAFPKLEPEPSPEPEKEIRYLSIAHKSNRLWYYLGEELETDGIAVRVFYTDMTDEVITLEDCDEIEVIGPDINLTGGQYVFVRYHGWEARFSVRYGGRADVRGIRVKAKPDKLYYKQGERFDPTGISVVALSQDLSETFEIPVEELEFKSFRNDEAGLVTVRVFYMDYYDTGFSVRVTNEKLLASVNSTKPTKVTYQVGEAFDPEGMVVTAKYYDNSVEEIDLSKVTITGFDSNEAGIKLVTVSYGGMSKSFSVRVV